MAPIQTLPHGSLNTFGDNEITVDSTIDDPAGYRGSAPGPGRGLVKFSGNRRRADGTQDEVVLVQFKRRYDDPNNLTGELYIGINNGGGGDNNMVDLILIHHDGVQILQPALLDSLIAAINGRITGAAPAASQAAAPSGRFTSPNGKYCWNYQDDGAVVLYDTHNSTDESTWTPKWAQRRSGHIESF